MTQSTIVETTVTVELNAQDVLAYVVEKKLVPEGWNFYSVEVTGCGISKGAKLVLRHSATSAIKGGG